MRLIFFCFAMCALPFKAALANDAVKDEALGIVDDVVSICQQDGMAACAPYIHGVDTAFEFIAAFEHLEKVEVAFDRFLADRYASDKAVAVNFDILRADVDLSLDISFTPEQFRSRVVNWDPVEGGFNLEMDSGAEILLREVNGEWHITMPAELNEQFDQVEGYYLAAQLKRSILLYHAHEAEMLQLSRDELEARLSMDLAPVLLAVFSEQQVPVALQWLIKDIQEVIEFYSQFNNIGEMREYIARENDL